MNIINKRTTNNRKYVSLQKKKILGCISILFVCSLYCSTTMLISRSTEQSTSTKEELMFRPPQPSSKTTTTKKPPVVVYSKLRGDQSGWVIFDMLKANSYCFVKNITYGGACGNSAHKSDIEDVLKTVGWNHILPLDCPPSNNSTEVDDSNSTIESTEFDYRIYPSNYFQHKSGRRMGSKQWQNYIKNHTDYSYFTSSSSSSTTKNIVVHIRRRDVTPCCYPNWYLPNIYFKLMIEKYINNNTKVHIYSQSKSYESWDDFNFTSSTSYNLYLDGPVGDVWRAILSSDIFIGSISEFSRVPSLFAKSSHIINPRYIDDDYIRKQTNITLTKLINNNCTEMELLMCKNLKDIWNK